MSRQGRAVALWLYILQLFVLLGFASLSNAALNVETDRFSGAVKLSTWRPDITWRPSLGLHAVLTTKRELVAGIILDSKSDGWRYLKCPLVSWLVDGKPFKLREARHEGTVGNGYVLEFLAISPVSIEQFSALANARKIEFKVCSGEFEATKEELNDLRAFYRGLVEMRKNPKASVTTIEAAIESARREQASADEAERAKQPEPPRPRRAVPFRVTGEAEWCMTSGDDADCTYADHAACSAKGSPCVHRLDLNKD